MRMLGLGVGKISASGALDLRKANNRYPLGINRRSSVFQIDGGACREINKSSARDSDCELRQSKIAQRIDSGEQAASVPPE